MPRRGANFYKNLSKHKGFYLFYRNKLKVNTEYEYDVFELLSSKLKGILYEKNYYTLIMNKISTERLKPQQDNEGSKGFKYQVLNSELGQVEREALVKLFFVTSSIKIIKNGIILR